MNIEHAKVMFAHLKKASRAMHHSLSTPPTAEQTHRLNHAATALKLYTEALEALLPDVPERKNILHKLVAISLVINYTIIHTDMDEDHNDMEGKRPGS